MKAREIMMRPVIAANKTTWVRDVAMQMLIGGFSGMPVAEPDGTLLGVITEFDVIRAIRRGRSPEATTVEEIMSDEVISVDVNESTDKVMTLMDTAHILRVPVTDDGKLVGVISRPDILRAYIDPNFTAFGGTDTQGS
jgi:CBS domain-containing protein